MDLVNALKNIKDPRVYRRVLGVKMVLIDTKANVARSLGIEWNTVNNWVNR
ncbi:hypothetical protein HRbin06_01016 [archaeon HR06]|nr:hypothetical protein HRbin06_01016 [archaeon HR06]